MCQVPACVSNCYEQVSNKTTVVSDFLKAWPFAKCCFIDLIPVLIPCKLWKRRNIDKGKGSTTFSFLYQACNSVLHSLYPCLSTLYPFNTPYINSIK